MQITQHPSPNFGERRGGVTPNLIVIHFTGMATHGAALARLCEAGGEVSAHYLISPSGEVVQMVPEDQRAWHAGAGAWGGLRGHQFTIHRDRVDQHRRYAVCGSPNGCC